MDTPKPNDTFRGSRKLLQLSQRLMNWHEDPLSDEDIQSALGASILPAFRYSQERLRGKVRKVTLESAFCHSADVAFRAAALGFPDLVIKAALLHDVVEDTSQSLEQVGKTLDEIEQIFSPEVARAVSQLTNRYAITFKAVAAKVRQDMPFSPRSGRAFQAAVEVLRWEAPPGIASQFSCEIDRLAKFLAAEADYTYCSHVAKRDRRFTLQVALERLIYHVYVEDLVSRARDACLEHPDGGHVAALVVKLFDAIDNIRTSEVSNRLSLFKLMNKSEALVDALQRHFANQPLDHELPMGVLASSIGPLSRLVALRLVDQLDARRRAVADNFSETRFAGLVDFLAEHTSRLQVKYRLPSDRGEAIHQEEEQVRLWADNRQKARLELETRKAGRPNNDAP